MRHMLHYAVLLALVACAANPSPVPMMGPAGDVSALAGEWVGEYRSVETGRMGSISFKLQAGSDTAFGDVLMVPRQAQTGGDVSQNPGVPGCTAAQILTIRFVHVAAQRISGTIEPYRCPDCGCLLVTVFRGELKGNRIDGDFVTTHSQGDEPPQKGSWWATRTPAPASP